MLLKTICAERPDIKSQFTSVLYQLLLDPSDRVCFEAILCVLGKFDNTERCFSYLNDFSSCCLQVAFFSFQTYITHAPDTFTLMDVVSV